MDERKRKYAQKCLNEWVGILGLEDRVVKMSMPSRVKWENQSSEWVSHADGSAGVWKITISPNQPDDYVSWSIAHELCHIILDPTYEYYYNAIGGVRKKSKAQSRNFTDYNSAENRVIEHFLRILYKQLNKTYPPHRASKHEIVVGPAVIGE